MHIDGLKEQSKASSNADVNSQEGGIPADMCRRSDYEALQN